MALKAVFFDLDDTLCDTTGSRGARAERAFLRLQASFPELERDSFIAQVLQTDPRTGWATGVSPVLEKLGVAGTPAGREAVDLWFFKGCAELLLTYPGAPDTIRALSRDYVLGVITNGREDRQRPKFEALGLSSHFDVFVTSDRAGAEKPSPQIFDFALKEAAVEAPEAVFVGDRRDTDIAGAKSAGLGAVLLEHNGASPAGIGPQPDASIRLFAALPALLRVMGTAIAERPR